jgi:hypothetical protein
MADNFPISSAPTVRLNTTTPPMPPVKPMLRELWMTRLIAKGPPVPSLARMWIRMKTSRDSGASQRGRGR